MKNKLFLKISYVAVAFVCVAVLVINVSVVPALAVTVDSLPVLDENVEVRYDSDSLILTVDDVSYDLAFHQDIRQKNDNGEYYDSWLVNRKTSGSDNVTDSFNWMFANWVDMDVNGNACPFSFWYSPSENRVYSFSGTYSSDSAYPYGYNLIECYNGSTFKFKYTAKANFVSVNYYDLNNSSFVNVGILSFDESGYGNGSSSIKLDWQGLEDCRIKEYVDIDYVKKAFPTDLMCVYSTYEISGFYEFNSQSQTIYTPDYYFDNQYIFYVENIGYTFIDSAEPLLNISNPSSSTTVLLEFEKECNKHIYTSVDGRGWTQLTATTSMYGLAYSISYQWFFDNVGGLMVAVLVYTNDESYGDEQLVTPEYGDLNDVISNLWNIVYSGGSFTGTGNYGVGNEIGTGFTWSEWLFLNFLSMDEINVSGVLGPDNEYYDYSGQTLFYLIKQMFYEMQNIRTVLDNEVDELTEVVHSDLKSVFDNITLSNHYLLSIDETLDSLPDYHSDLKDIKELLANMDFSASGSVSNFDMDILEQYLVAIDDTSEITNWFSELDKSIDDLTFVEVVDEIEDVLDSEIADAVDDEVEDLFENLTKENVTKDFDVVTGYITSAITMISKGTLLLNAFEYTSGLSNGIGWINANVTSIYDVSGALKPVLLLGASMFVVNLIVRRGN